MPKRRIPSQRRSQEIVNSIISATSQMVGQFGVDGTTVDKIATRAGVSVGSIYQYFSDKGSILTAFAHRALDSNRMHMITKLEEWQDLPVRELVPLMIDYMADHWENSSATMRHVFVYANTLGLRAIQMRMRREVIFKLADVLRRHKDELRVRDYPLAAATVIHAGVAVTTAKFLDPELPFSTVELKDELTKMVSRYLVKDEH